MVVNLTPTQTSSNVTVGIVDDSEEEMSETFLVRSELMSTDVISVTVSSTPTTVTINDDDSKCSGFSCDCQQNLVITDTGFCPANTYMATNVNDVSDCRSCPANSLSSAGENSFCGCVLGYYRNTLEDIHAPCTSKTHMNSYSHTTSCLVIKHVLTF